MRCTKVSGFYLMSLNKTVQANRNNYKQPCALVRWDMTLWNIFRHAHGEYWCVLVKAVNSWWCRVCPRVQCKQRLKANIADNMYGDGLDRCVRFLFYLSSMSHNRCGIVWRCGKRASRNNIWPTLSFPSTVRRAVSTVYGPQGGWFYLKI